MKILTVDDMASWREYNKNAIVKIFDNVDIETASSAEEGLNKILENNNSPYDIVITDLQMEDNYAPKYAGEWLVEQIKILPNYYNTKIIIVSASYCIKKIAESLSVDYIPKSALTNDINLLKNILE